MEAISFQQDKPKIRMIGAKILVRPDVLKEKEVRGIIIPVANNNPLEEGTVILVSAEVAPYVSAGERILYPKGTGTDQEYDGVRYKFINGPTATSFGDVWAII
jgi:co-chaperonin GroES (HSP10)